MMVVVVAVHGMLVVVEGMQELVEDCIVVEVGSGVVVLRIPALALLSPPLA